MAAPRTNSSHDQNRVPTLLGVSTADGTTPVPAEVDPLTGQLQVAGGGGGTQYQELVTTSPATGTVAEGRYKSSAPTLTDGQLYALQLDVSGNLKVAGTFSSTPPTDVAPATQNITVVDSGTTSTVSANGQALITGSVTANSAATFSVASLDTIRVQVTGVWTGTLSIEGSIDGGTTYFAIGLHQGAYTTSAFIANFVGGANIAGITNFRVRATATITGTATVKIIESANTQSVYIANAAPSGNIVSLLNSSSATLLSGAVFTGVGEDVSNFAEIRVTVISNVASATDGLSMQQSTDNSNWDITDVYTVAATTGKTFVIPRQAKYFRIVYTNGGTNQGSFRLQTILDRQPTAPSSNRASDAYTNETDLIQSQDFLMGYNGTTWERLRTVGTGVLSASAVLTAGSAIIGKVGIDQTTPGTTNAVSANQGTAAALTGGWPTINGEAGDVTGTFTNATQTTSVTANNLDGYGNTLISINGTYGTATAIFEGSDDGGTTWYTVQAARDNTNVIETGYTSQTNTSQTWQINNPGFDSLRIRSTAVASGTVNVRLSSSAAPVASGTIIGLGTSIPAGANVIGALTANQSVNNAQVNGVTPLMGNGVTGTGSQRVTVASDNTPFPIKIDQTTPGTTNLVALAANQSVNNAQVSGNATSVGVGASGTGTQRVVLANDAGKTLVSAGGSAASSGNNTLVAAGTNKLKVYAFTLSTVSATAITCIFQSGAGGTELWRVVLQAPTSVSTGANLVVQPPAWLFATGAATLLNLNLSSANAVHWSVSYWDEA